MISFVYERGWRQGFAWAGFPGVDKEFGMAMQVGQAELEQMRSVACMDRLSN